MVAAMTSATSARRRPTVTRQNSSPPMRAAVDPGSAAAARPRTSATERSRSSPVSWPSSSFTRLSPSTSHMTMQVSWPDSSAASASASAIAAVGQARQRVVGDEVTHLRLEVDARDGAGDERGEHLGAGDVVDPERRTRAAADGVRAGPRRCR